MNLKGIRPVDSIKSKKVIQSKKKGFVENYNGSK